MLATLTAKLQNAVTQATTNDILSAAGNSNLCWEYKQPQIDMLTPLGGHSSAGFHNMRLHSIRTDQLLEQMGKTQAETLNTAERHGICLRTEKRRSASGKISPTSAFRVHIFEVDEIPVAGGRWKLRLWSSGLWQQVLSWVATNISKPVVCSFEMECALKMEATNPQNKKSFQPTTNYGVLQTMTTIS